MTSRLTRCAFLVLTALLGGCQLLQPQEPEAPPAPPPPPPIVEPLATYEFEFDPETDHVIGTLQVTRVQGEDTLSDIARRFNLGYEEIVRANPGVDPWLPGEGREIVLPTQFVLPDAPREGIVINLAQLRMFISRKPKKASRVRSSRTRSASVRWVGRRPRGRRRSPQRRRIRLGSRQRRCVKNTRRQAIHCLRKCRPDPTIRSVRT